MFILWSNLSLHDVVRKAALFLLIPGNCAVLCIEWIPCHYGGFLRLKLLRLQLVLSLQAVFLVSACFFFLLSLLNLGCTNSRQVAQNRCIFIAAWALFCSVSMCSDVRKLFFLLRIHLSFHLIYTPEVYVKGHQIRNCIFLGCGDVFFLVLSLRVWRGKRSLSLSLFWNSTVFVLLFI